ncbi:hypothetical protein BD309DRAFT_1024278 [Dichomitus squalens]|nr:hypothetical protein BD309DRAFT_1024278 [Dichomitus squalens]
MTWELQSELLDYFPLKGYNFVLVRDYENKSTPHLGFFLRALEQQTENPVERNGIPAFVRPRQDATSAVRSVARKRKLTQGTESTYSPGTPRKRKLAERTNEATSPLRRSPRQRKLTEGGAYYAGYLKAKKRRSM